LVNIGQQIRQIYVVRPLLANVLISGEKRKYGKVVVNCGIVLEIATRSRRIVPSGLYANGLNPSCIISQTFPFHSSLTEAFPDSFLAASVKFPSATNGWISPFGPVRRFWTFGRILTSSQTKLSKSRAGSRPFPDLDRAKRKLLPS
jgi:hypothetical protein